MKMHVVNYLYARELKLDFDYFCPHASNDMFVRSGLSNYISGYDAGGFFRRFDITASRWQHMKNASHDSQLSKVMKKIETKTLRGGQLEGSFYSREVTNKMMGLISDSAMCEIGFILKQGSSRAGSILVNQTSIGKALRRLPLGFFYAKEEIYFPTIGIPLANKVLEHNYCYINWDNELKVDYSEIDAIRSGEHMSLDYLRKENNISDDIDECHYQLFAVKRINREIDDPVRKYITCLQH